MVQNATTLNIEQIELDELKEYENVITDNNTLGYFFNFVKYFNTEMQETQRKRFEKINLCASANKKSFRTPKRRKLHERRGLYRNVI